ncbi:MAG: cytochrome c oxidase assembly protein [Steroidobacteraceae bacterium]
MSERTNPSVRKANRQLLARLLMMTLGSFAFGFALVPLYSVLCDLTGFGDQTQLAQAANSPVAGRIDERRDVTVEFMTQLPSVGNFEFTPVQKSIDVHPGALNEAEFIVRNLTGQDTVTQAVPNITPGLAAGYLRKTECFCFTPQRFAAGETRRLKVRFFIDPALPDYLDRLTLSYTLYDQSTLMGAAGSN